MATTHASTDQDWVTATNTANLRHTSGRSLRKSCDRCHQQKLRCEGSKVSLVACTRCQRAGVDCVYSVRSSKQPSKHGSTSRNQSIDCGRPVPIPAPSQTATAIATTATATTTTGGGQGGQGQGPPTPAPSHDFNVLDTFDADLMGDDFNTSRWDPLGMQVMTDNHHVLTPPQAPPSVSTGMSTGGGTSVILGFDHSPSPPNMTEGSADISVRLCSVSQALEGIFRRIIALEDPADRSTPQYVVDEVFSTFNAFTRVLSLDSIRPRPLSRESLLEECMDTKHGCMAAQCYVLSVKLMVYLSEKMLQNLLVSPPSSTPRSSPFNLGGTSTTATGPATQLPAGGGGGGGFGDNADHDNIILGSFGSDDFSCSGPPPPPPPGIDSFDRVLDSTVNMLQTGTGLLARMEELLEIPPRIAAGGGGAGGPQLMSHYTTSPEKPQHAQQGARQQQQQQQQHTHKQAQQQRKQSLPARLVLSTWEHETSIGNKCPVSYFKRCRAAILGLAQNHA